MRRCWQMCSESGLSLLRMMSACHPSSYATANRLEPNNPACSLMPPLQLAESSSVCTGMFSQITVCTFSAFSAAPCKKVRPIPVIHMPLSCTHKRLLWIKSGPAVAFTSTSALGPVFTQHLTSSSGCSPFWYARPACCCNKKVSLRFELGNRH